MTNGSCKGLRVTFLRVYDSTDGQRINEYAVTYAPIR